MKKILLINICKERLHYFEFVKPIEDVLKRNKINYFVRHYKNLKEESLKKANRIIICGTGLKDNEFLRDLDKFEWLRDFERPILGICGGMQIIGLIFKGRLKKKIEIGFYKEHFKKEFLGLHGEEEVYHLHNNYIDFSSLREFEIFSQNNYSTNKVTQAVKHRTKPIYAVLFHPEVRHKHLIENFCKLTSP